VKTENECKKNTLSSIPEPMKRCPVCFHEVEDEILGHGNGEGGIFGEYCDNCGWMRFVTVWKDGYEIDERMPG